MSLCPESEITPFSPFNETNNKGTQPMSFITLANKEFVLKSIYYKD